MALHHGVLRGHEDRVLVYASEYARICNAIDDVAHAPTELELVTDRIRRDARKFSIKRDELEYLETRTKSLYKEWQGLLGSGSSLARATGASTRLWIYLRNPANHSAALAERCAGEEDAYRCALQAEEEARAELLALRAEVSGLEQRVRSLREAVEMHDHFQEQIVILLDRVFRGPNPGYPEEDDLEEAFMAAFEEHERAEHDAARFLRGAANAAHASMSSFRVAASTSHTHAAAFRRRVKRKREGRAYARAVHHMLAEARETLVSHAAASAATCMCPTCAAAPPALGPSPTASPVLRLPSSQSSPSSLWSSLPSSPVLSLPSAVTRSTSYSEIATLSTAYSETSCRSVTSAEKLAFAKGIPDFGGAGTMSARAAGPTPSMRMQVAADEMERIRDIISPTAAAARLRISTAASEVDRVRVELETWEEQLDGIRREIMEATAFPHGRGRAAPGRDMRRVSISMRAAILGDPKTGGDIGARRFGTFHRATSFSTHDGAQTAWTVNTACTGLTVIPGTDAGCASASSCATRPLSYAFSDAESLALYLTSNEAIAARLA